MSKPRPLSLEATAPWPKQKREALFLSRKPTGRIASCGSSDSASQDAFRAALTGAIAAARQALAYNQNSFENWITEGAVYSAVVPTGIDGAYENALAVYGEARKRNPLTPEIDYRIAQIEAAKGNRDAARAAAEASIALKADYTPAILLIAQLA